MDSRQCVGMTLVSRQLNLSVSTWPVRRLADLGGMFALICCGAVPHFSRGLMRQKMNQLPKGKLGFVRLRSAVRLLKGCGRHVSDIPKESEQAVNADPVEG